MQFFWLVLNEDLGVSKEMRRYVSGMIWCFGLGRRKADRSCLCVRCAAEYLNDLLVADPFVHLRPQYLLLCVQKLRAGQNVAWTLKFMHNLLQSMASDLQRALSIDLLYPVILEHALRALDRDYSQPSADTKPNSSTSASAAASSQTTSSSAALALGAPPRGGAPQTPSIARDRMRPASPSLAAMTDDSLSATVNRASDASYQLLGRAERLSALLSFLFWMYQEAYRHHLASRSPLKVAPDFKLLNRIWRLVFLAPVVRPAFSSLCCHFCESLNFDVCLSERARRRGSVVLLFESFDSVQSSSGSKQLLCSCLIQDLG